MTEIYEITLKKVRPNDLHITRLVISLEDIPRDQATFKAMEIAERLGLVFEMSYIIKGFKE